MKKNDVQKLNKHVKSKSEVGKDPKKDSSRLDPKYPYVKEQHEHR